MVVTVIFVVLSVVVVIVITVVMEIVAIIASKVWKEETYNESSTNVGMPINGKGRLNGVRCGK